MGSQPVKNFHVDNLYANGWHSAMAILNWAFIRHDLDNGAALKILHAYKHLYQRGAF